MKLLLKFTDEFGVKTSNFFIIFIFLIFISACNKPNPQPEVLDKVFLDLVKAESDYVKAKAAKQKELDSINEQLLKAKPRSVELKKLKDSYFKTKNDLYLLEQRLLYVQLRKHSRLIQDRQEYMESWRNNEAWSTDSSFENYKLERKLATAPKEWKKASPTAKPADKKKKDSKGPPEAGKH